MTAADLLRNARLRSGRTQSELARASGFTQAQISRWEAGVREPPFAVLAELVDACGLDLSLQLFQRDRSFHELATDQLLLEPWDRVDELLQAPGEAWGRRELRQVFTAAAAVPGGALVTGEIASVLHGGVRMLDAALPEIVPARPQDASAYLAANGWLAGIADRRFAPHVRWAHVLDREHPLLELIEQPAGTLGYADLLRDAVMLPGVPMPVVSVRDLLRIADASPWDQDRSRRLELRALLDLAQESRTAAAAAVA